MKWCVGYRFLTDMPDITTDDTAIRQLLQSDPKIALIGASANRSRDSYRIFAYLRGHGFTVVPVTPKPDLIDGVEPAPDLETAKERLGGRIDIVDVFRAAQHTPAIAEDAARLGAGTIWLQFNTVHPDAVQTALDAGMTVVADRCIKVEHMRLIG